MAKQTVPEMLEAAAALYRQRNAIYGDNYKSFGKVMVACFPKGVVLNTVDDHNRFGIFVQIVGKVTRYAAQFKNGGHVDSLDDTTVYAQMLKELDEDAQARSQDQNTSSQARAGNQGEEDQGAAGGDTKV